MEDFASTQMHRHGWKQGKGLGKNENGIMEPIKVSIKNDTTGVGHDHSKQFTFHWWEHAFETACKNIQVKEDNGDVQLVVADTKITTSTQKVYKKSSVSKNMLYGRFVKSGVLNNGEIKKTDSCSSSSDSDSDEPHRPITKGSKMLSDEDLLRACGGRTAHKGARHGIKLSAKLERLAQQESLEDTNISTNTKVSQNQKRKKKIKKQVSEETERSTIGLALVQNNKKNKKAKKRKSEPCENGSPKNNLESKQSSKCDSMTNNKIRKVKKEKTNCRNKINEIKLN